MKPVDILTSHNLKRTSCREGIIEAIMDANEALSENEIRDQLMGNYDRTTFYRSFKTLEEHKILHKIVVDNQVVKYALDNSKQFKKEHAHFYCSECHTVKCLEPVIIESIELPKGCTEEKTEILVKGVCGLCRKELDKN